MESTKATKTSSAQECSNNVTKTFTKVPRKEAKEGKKAAGSSLMDIGVWNPDAIQGSNQNGNFKIS